MKSLPKINREILFQISDIRTVDINKFYIDQKGPDVSFIKITAIYGTGFTIFKSIADKKDILIQCPFAIQKEVSHVKEEKESAPTFWGCFLSFQYPTWEGIKRSAFSYKCIAKLYICIEKSKYLPLKIH